MGFQARLSALCEAIGSITMRLSKNEKWLQFLKKINIMPMKYQLEQLEIRSYPVNISRSLAAAHYLTSMTQAEREQNVLHPELSPTFDLFDQIHPETGFYVHQHTVQNDSLFNEDDNTRLSKKTDEIRDALEESTIRTNNDLRKIVTNLQNELEDIKRQLVRQKL